MAPASAAQAEVVSAGPNGFEISHSVQLVAPPATVYAAFGQIGGWWAKGHTYSGDSANLRLSLTPGGCFCERLPNGGGIEHMRVTYVDPGKRVVMTGALGPLLYEATAGVMDVQIERLAGGTRVHLELPGGRVRQGRRGQARATGRSGAGGAGQTVPHVRHREQPHATDQARSRLTKRKPARSPSGRWSS